MRIVVLNNYDLAAIREGVRRKVFPDHLLFGINVFEEAGHEIEIAPFRQSRGLAQLQAALVRLRLDAVTGDLEQQWFARRHGRRADLIYAPCQTQAQWLGFQRARGRWPTPIVCVAHHPLHTGLKNRLLRPYLRRMLRGIDRYPALSRPVADGIERISGFPGKAPAVHWAPDAHFYPRRPPTPGVGATACGKAERDFDLFGSAATRARMAARIVCPRSCVTSHFTRFGPNVAVSAPVSYPELLAAYAAARVVAIPLRRTTVLTGATTLLDCMGMGKPVIMTRNRYLDVDIEAEGIGRWVAPGDIQGWIDALEYFDTHPEAAVEMGQRARRLVDEGYNSAAFAADMLRICLEVCSGARAGQTGLPP
jgi:hypothetical protein